MTLTTLQQLNSYHRIVDWPQTDHLNEFFLTLVTAIFSHFLASEADHPTPQQICIEKKYKCTGSHFLIPCLKTNTKYQIKIACKYAAVVLPSSENNSFSMQTLTSILCNYWTCYNRGCSRSVSDFIKNCWQWFFLGKTKKFNASSLICLSVAMATASKYFGQKSAKITLKFNNFTAKLPFILPFFHNIFHFVW